MVITISDRKVQIVGDPEILFEQDSLVSTLAATTDKNADWEYNVDIYMPTTNRYNSIIMTRNSNMLSVDLTRQMLPVDGRYIFQFRGQKNNGEVVYHTDKFELWVKDSIDLNKAYNPMPAEFYQLESEMKQMVEEVKQTAAETLPEINETTNGQFLSNDGTNAQWADVPDSGISQDEADARYLQLSGGTMTGNIDLNGNDLDNVNHIKAAGTYVNAGIQFNSNGTIIDFTTGYSKALELSANAVDVVNHTVKNVSGIEMSSEGTIDNAKFVGSETDITGRTCTEYDADSINFWVNGKSSMTVYENNINAGGYPIKNVGEPSADTDVATKEYVDDAVAGITGGITQEEADARYVQLTGGTMTGALNMGEQQLLGVTNIVNGDTPTANTGIALSNGAISFDVGSARVLSLYGSAINAVNHRIQNLSNPQDNTDAANKQYVDSAVSGVRANIDTVSGTVDDILDGTEALPYLDEASGDGRYLQLTGGTLTGALSVGNNKITMGATPTETTDVTNKGYVDGVVKVVSDEVDGILAGTTPVAIPAATETHVGGIKPGAGTTVSSDGTLTIIVPVPTVEDNGKILVAENGVWVAKSLSEIQGSDNI